MAKTTTTEPTCPGACCAAFYLPRKIREFRRDQHRITDGEQIADMLVSLTPKQARERLLAVGVHPDNVQVSWEFRGHHFTCRHWDEDTRLCGIYEDRPDMCRGFPYGKPCPHGCGKVCGEPLRDGSRHPGEISHREE